MDKFFLLSILLFSFGEIVLTSAQEGVKTHHHSSTTRNDTAGYCYKRVPYYEALRFNTTVSPDYSGPPNRLATRWNATVDRYGNGWVVVADCCEGYRSNPQKTLCEPACEGGCYNGQCVAPEVCVCNPGYTNAPGQRGYCQPDCGPYNCDGGQCVAPGVCRCGVGYTRDPRTNSCVPMCRSGCTTNEECIAPDRCECKPGYQRDPYSRVCIRSSPSPRDDRDCRRPCVNGICIGYDVCNCHDGYIMDPADPTRTRCIPMCVGGCPNGVCSGPNLCLCLPGYRKDRSTKGSQACVPMHNNY